MRVVGIDPGLTGAIASWNGKELLIEDVPKMKAAKRGNEVNLPELKVVMRRVFDHGESVDAVYSERPQLRPAVIRKGGKKGDKHVVGQGVASQAKFFEVAGLLTGAATMRCDNLFQPTPSQWKKVMKLGRDKEIIRTKAIKEFPKFALYFKRKGDHNRAEAAFLALHGFQQELTKQGKPTETKRRKRVRLRDLV